MTIEPGTDDYAESWLRYSTYMEPAYRSALDTLGLPYASHGLDAGCGPGAMFNLFTSAIGPDGTVTGVDVSEAHLNTAARITAMHGLENQVTLQTADVTGELPFASDRFDWVWCADVLWPHRIHDIDAVIDEFMRVLRPGGTVAIFFNGFLRGSLVPGWGHLELPMTQAAADRWFGGPGVIAETERAVNWLRRAGLEHVTHSVHVTSHTAPLEPPISRYLTDYLQIKFGNVTNDDARRYGLNDNDMSVWRELVDPQSAKFILNDPGYFSIEIAILASGRVPVDGHQRDEG